MTVIQKLSPALLTLLLASCAVGPDYVAPQTAEPAQYSRTLEREADRPLEDAWWTGFSEPELNALVETALTRNLDIRQSAERLVAAEALAGAARSDFLPTLDAGADASVRTSGRDTASAGLSFSQIVDVNGQLRRTEERARANVLATQFELADIQRLTAATAVSLYVDARRARARLTLLDTSLELQQRTLDIVERRAEAGLSADLDVRRATADLARTRAQRGALQLQEVRARNALAVLLGQAPGGVLDALSARTDAPSDALGLSYEAAIPVGVPADLLRQRPDLRAAEARLVAATADIGVQQADLYPALRLPGAVTADLSDGPGDAIAASLSAVLDVPLFDFGRRQAEVDASRARATEAALAYQQAVLGALEEVETGLVAIESVEARLTDLEIAVTESERAYDQLNALYREGLASFIDVLDAQRTLIGSREALVDSEADLADAIIALNLALAAPTA
ncbi:efflux transporter outer membrane subunit [Oceanicaulis sp. UBA2681]|uniref:efflux transporter outer membrane subunit n=1 Tax=Oceanicaulis sp. UBA2681 TaxID=1947007 RepID=UPI00257E537A|nr:efflux transporter outer membrane subunit [Oceanicaulis sp. UBA2681]